MTYWTRAEIEISDSADVDAFGRLRVGNPVTLFDTKQLHDNQPLFWDEVQGGGAAASSHSSSDAATTMTVDAAGEYLIRQTYQRMNYQPGKSQLVFLTTVLGAAVANVEKKLGYFNSSTSAPYTAALDGIYLKQDGSTQYVCVAKNGSETAVAQASWNVDPMDGTGPSGFTIDWTKTQILVIDFEWLGVGRVRIGFNINGETHIVHVFNHANINSSVYMSSPNHSLRYEIRSTGGTASLVHICGSVTSEGGEHLSGNLRCVTTGGTHLDANTENTVYALIGLRLKSTNLDSLIRVLSFAVQIHTASDKLEYLLIWNPTVAGTFTYTGLTNSPIEVAYGVTANTVTGGLQLQAGYAEASTGGQGAGSASDTVVNSLKLGAAIDGTRDELVLCGRPIGGSSSVDVEGVVVWRELQ